MSRPLPRGMGCAETAVHMPCFAPRRWFLALLIVAATCSTGGAFAQSLEPLTRQRTPPHTQELVISRDDCEANDNGIVARFTMVNMVSISVWASAGSCTQQDRMNGICEEVLPT
ncbi:MAG: hypothetical protein AAGA56_26595, partial [Myxococcota bacterium]